MRQVNTLVFVLLITFLLAGVGCQHSDEIKPSPQVVNVIIDFGQGNTQRIDLNIEIQTSAFNLLEQACLKLGLALEYDASTWGYLGIWIEGIGNVKNNVSEGRYWLYYVNETLADVAVDKQMIKPGDVLKFRFKKVF